MKSTDAHSTEDVWTLKPHQLKAYEAIVDKRRVIANMPTGWGKSFLLCCLAAAHLLDARRKVIICVPQRPIAKGFAKPMTIRLPNGSTVRWGIRHNLCDPSPAKVAQLVRFIKESVADALRDRVVLTTHMSLSYAFRTLTKDEVTRCLSNTDVWFDEGHHIMSSEQGQNQLGQVINTLLDLDDHSTRILLATAYFFRGDHLPIIHDSHLASFYRYHLPFDEYWATLKYIKRYRYDFVAYKGSVFHELETVLRASQEPTIIYCPPEGHKTLLGKPKRGFVKQIEKLCNKYCMAKSWTLDTKPRKNQKVTVDLVDTAQRTEKIAFIAEHGDRVAAVFAVGMFREGADWVEASRVIDLVPTGSDQDRNQRFGRIIRDAPGKECVNYISFFPYVVEQDEEARRHELSKLYAHFHASLVLENALQPIKVQLDLSNKKHEDDRAEETGRLDLLGCLNEHTQESIVRGCYEELIKLQEEKVLTGRAVSHQEAKHTIISVLKAHGIKDDLDGMARQVVLVMRRKSNVRINTNDLVAAGFDKVWSTDIFDGLITYSAGFGGPKTLSEIRKVIGQVFDQMWFGNYSKIRELPAIPSTDSSAYWWCTHNKVLHQRNALNKEKVRLLEAIPWWSWTQGFGDRWQEMYERVKDLPTQPKAKTKEYAWVRQQRRLYDIKKLDASKVKLLEMIAWWRWANLDGNWSKMYEMVNLRAEPPLRGTREYEWVRTQRKADKDNKLPADRKRLLEAIPWWQWTTRESDREKGLELLKAVIKDAEDLGHTKAQARSVWAKALNIGEDQIHKYVRLLPDECRKQWNQLGDARRSA